MAKASTKPAKAESKPATSKKEKKASPHALIEQACILALKKLSELDIEYQLQSEINWCLGSYRGDGNPIGLYQMAERSVVVLKDALAKKAKGINAKLITDIEAAMKAKP